VDVLERLRAAIGRGDEKRVDEVREALAELD